LVIIIATWATLISPVNIGRAILGLVSFPAIEKLWPADVDSLLQMNRQDSKSVKGYGIFELASETQSNNRFPWPTGSRQYTHQEGEPYAQTEFEIAEIRFDKKLHDFSPPGFIHYDVSSAWCH